MKDSMPCGGVTKINSNNNNNNFGNFVSQNRQKKNEKGLKSLSKEISKNKTKFSNNFQDQSTLATTTRKSAHSFSSGGGGFDQNNLHVYNIENFNIKRKTLVDILEKFDNEELKKDLKKIFEQKLIGEMHFKTVQSSKALFALPQNYINITSNLITFLMCCEILRPNILSKAFQILAEFIRVKGGAITWSEICYVGLLAMDTSISQDDPAFTWAYTIAAIAKKHTAKNVVSYLEEFDLNQLITLQKTLTQEVLWEKFTILSHTSHLLAANGHFEILSIIGQRFFKTTETILFNCNENKFTLGKIKNCLIYIDIINEFVVPSLSLLLPLLSLDSDVVPLCIFVFILAIKGSNNVSKKPLNYTPQSHTNGGRGAPELCDFSRERVQNICNFVLNNLSGNFTNFHSPPSSSGAVPTASRSCLARQNSLPTGFGKNSSEKISIDFEQEEFLLKMLKISLPAEFSDKFGKLFENFNSNLEEFKKAVLRFGEIFKYLKMNTEMKGLLSNVHNAWCDFDEGLNPFRI